MVIVLVTSFLVLVVISFAIYRFQRVVPNDTADRQLRPAPDFEGLFADSVKEEQARLDAAQSEQDVEEKRKRLLSRADNGDKEALPEAHQTGDKNLYEEVLNALVRRAENDRQLLAIASYVSRNDALHVNIALANAFTETWKRSPNRHTTAEMLHVAALAGDAALYQQAIVLVMQYWREHRLQDTTSEELVALIESEFWLVPSNARNSGAGFLLKRELAKIRRELLDTKKP